MQFEANVTFVGEEAWSSLEEGMMILFNESAPQDAREYCFIHDQGKACGEVSLESTLMIGGQDFIVTSVGECANRNLANLGHVTIRFDGQLTPEMPGCIHVIGKTPVKIKCGDSIIFG